MTLRDNLTDIRGIGDAKADAIMELIEEHDVGGVDRGQVEDAYEYLVEEERPGYAEKFLRRALGYNDE